MYFFFYIGCVSQGNAMIGQVCDQDNLFRAFMALLPDLFRHAPKEWRQVEHRTMDQNSCDTIKSFISKIFSQKTGTPFKELDQLASQILILLCCTVPLRIEFAQQDLKGRWLLLPIVDGVFHDLCAKEIQLSFR